MPKPAPASQTQVTGASLYAFDAAALRPDVGWLAGVDEAGRGPLAGPVVAAAVLLPRAWLGTGACPGDWLAANDSKRLGAVRRTRLAAALREAAARGEFLAATAEADVHEIDRLDILGATVLAMRRALEAAGVVEGAEGWRCRGLPVQVLVDGPPLRRLTLPHEGIVKGDGRSLAIALASILAKTTRDAQMLALDRDFPQYGFARHKGYGTAEHRAALLRHGPCVGHRALFVSGLLEGASLRGKKAPARS